MDASEDLERQAAELDPGLTGEEKARRLRPALEAQAQESERLEHEDDEAEPPTAAAPQTAEHEKDMLHRGFAPGNEPS